MRDTAYATILKDTTYVSYKGHNLLQLWGTWTLCYIYEGHNPCHIYKGLNLCYTYEGHNLCYSYEITAYVTIMGGTIDGNWPWINP